MNVEKATELIKEAHRNKDTLPPYNNSLVEQVLIDVRHLIEENTEDAQANLDRTTGENISYLPTVRIRHLTIQRNVRCLLSYHYNRLRCLRDMRWEFGSVLPAEIKANLSAAEASWFNKYSNILAKYMRSVGDEGGVNLCVSTKPPKSLYIEVKCLMDYGKYQLTDGSEILLKKNTRYYLPRAECEEFIRLEIFEHIIN